MNKYEKSKMFNVHIMRGLFIVILMFNLFLPVYKPFSIGLSSAFQIAIVVVHFIGLLEATGYGEQRVLIVPVFIIRLLEVLWYTIISSKDFNIVLLGMLLLLDLIFLALILLDKKNYTYERVRE